MLPVQWHRISERIDFWVTAVGPIRPKLSLLEPVVWRLKRHERWTALYPHIHVPDSLSRCVWPTTNAGHSPVKSVNRRQTWLYSYYIRQGLECSHCYHLPLHIPYVEINIRGGEEAPRVCVPLCLRGRETEVFCPVIWDSNNQCEAQAGYRWLPCTAGPNWSSSNQFTLYHDRGCVAEVLCPLYPHINKESVCQEGIITWCVQIN